MSRKTWGVVLVVGILMIPIGSIWMAYAIMQTGSTSVGAPTSTSVTVWPIVAFIVAFIGGTLVTVGSLGFFFRWMSGDGDDASLGTSPSETLAHAVPTTRVGWGGGEAGPRPRHRRRGSEPAVRSCA